MQYCTNCGKQLGDDFEFCPECGEKVMAETRDTSYCQFNEPTKICPYCGEYVPVDAFYCLNCGRSFYYNRQEDFYQVQKRIMYQFGTWKDKWTALALCFFLGWFGAHKYYEGKIGMGILYTLTCGLFFIGWIIDLFVLLFKPNPYLAKR